MRVHVISHHSGGKEAVHEGTPEEVRKSLLASHPWLVAQVGYHAPLQAVLATMNGCQAFSVRADSARGSDLGKTEGIATPHLVGVHNEALRDQIAGGAERELLIAAAAFVAGVEDPSEEAISAAFATHDDDPEAAALQAAGLEPTEENRRAVRGVLSASKPLQKSEIPPVHLKDLTALEPAADAFVEELKRASEADAVFPVALSGKHSQGALLSYDPENHTRIILKPGDVGKNNPASGVRQEKASQSAREVACYAAAEEVFGLHDVIPECHLVAYEGHPQVAAMRALSFRHYRNMNAVRKEGADKPRRILSAFLPDGTLHKWAAMCFTLGNVDCHSGNVLAGASDVYLIDWGSALAGSDFNPGRDPRTFVPYFLRVFAPQGFKLMAPEDRLRALPRLHADAAANLATWIKNLDPRKLEAVLLRYGINPKASVDRLKRLQQDCGIMDAALAVNAAWTV